MGNPAEVLTDQFQMPHRKPLLYAPGDQTLGRIPKFLTFQREDVIVDEMNLFAVPHSLHDTLP